MATPRTALIAGNWKMNTTADSAMALVEDMLDDLDALEGIEVVLCPPFISLVLLQDMVAETTVALGAQNMFWEPQGAFTGEISAPMLQSLCRYVILGHSERRTLFGETDGMVARKVQTALAHGLRPIICVGENRQENDSGLREEVLARQVRAVFTHMDPLQAGICVVAYEPLWAIGSGHPSTGPDAQAAIGSIRSLLVELVGSAAAGAMRLLYGGSVTGANAGEFFREVDIDGALVGGASLRPDDFVRICAIAQQTRR